VTCIDGVVSSSCNAASINTTSCSQTNERYWIGAIEYIETGYYQDKLQVKTGTEHDDPHTDGEEKVYEHESPKFSPNDPSQLDGGKWTFET
jgi:hypothetical protein